MQTQLHLSGKKNKVTVPFYSPPLRLGGQTAADIIKEARAAVMTSGPIGIKPVFTNRPFTPNQTERTLFGNIKKNKSRPPSSFSLRHLKSQEQSSQVKLPSIDVAPRKKTYSTFHNSKNLSLDNLTEDYDAEVFEEVASAGDEKLPTWKKSHSCPKEGRLSKVASLNDINHSLVDFVNYKEDNLHNQGNLEEKNQFDYNLQASLLFGDSIKSEQEKNYSEQYQQNPIMEKGGGDCEVSQSVEEHLGTNNKEVVEEVVSVKFGDGGTQPKENSSQDDQESKPENGVKKLETSSKVTHHEGEKYVTKKEEQNFEDKNFSKRGNFVDKLIISESQSEYLMSLKRGFKNTDIVKTQDSVPLEILQLYETARYYGVEVDHSDNKSSATRESVTDNWSSKIGEKSDNGQQFKENLNRSNEQKQNETTGKLKVITAKSQRETEVGESGNVEYEMNNKKRYHVAAEKGDAKEKAYKKWNNKQEEVNKTPQEFATNDGWNLFWKNSYYREKDGKDEKSKEDSSRQNLQRLINKISAMANKDVDNLEIYEATSELYDLIKSSKITLDSKLKEGILRTLYLFVDNEKPEVLLSLAKNLFFLKEENCLSVACKIIFKVARFDTNDHLFLDEEDVLELFLEGIGRASPLDCAESCIYGYGALKFLTLNHNILSRILHMGALDLMTLHLKMINNAFTENGSVGEQTQHALFQLTGALRHIAAGEGALPLFLTTNCISIISNTLRFFYKDEDVTVNISRTLSLLSTDEIVTQTLMQVDNILTLLIDLIERYKENDKILIRLAFCLGNIVEHSDLARVQLSRSDKALTTLLNVLKLYIDKDLDVSLKGDSNTNSEDLSSEVIDDVIVKVIRIIANMSMNPIVGSNLSPATKEKKSLQLSKLLSVLLMRKDPGITLLATLGCLNNISYYCNTHSVLIDITQGVERVLGLESIECQIEAARVLGNLTRHKGIRDLIHSTGGVDLLIKLLSSSDQEVVRCACGALVNMMLDPETRKAFVKAQGIDKLVNALELFPGDWSLASLATRAIWNSCGNDVSFAVLYNNVEHLSNILASSLEEENWNDGDIAWEEFASVATDLLEKISIHLESA